MNFALIPAAGKSSRMGRPKLALPLGGKSVLEHVGAAFRQAGVEHVVAVIGPHVPELIPLAWAAGAEVCSLPFETPDMRATIAEGLRWLEEHHHPRPVDRWFLSPGDHPTLCAEVISRLLEAAHHRPADAIHVPTCQGKRGHPTLFPWARVTDILQFEPHLGLNAYVRRHSAGVVEVPAHTADVLIDLDTPEDYQELLRAWPSYKKLGH
jgi:molybdenum cofactor cytidylyltransferase